MEINVFLFNGGSLVSWASSARHDFLNVWIKTIDVLGFLTFPLIGSLQWNKSKLFNNVLIKKKLKLTDKEDKSLKKINLEAEKI